MQDHTTHDPVSTSDKFESFQDLESVLNSFEISDNKHNKGKRRKSLASSIKFWKTKDNGT